VRLDPEFLLVFPVLVLSVVVHECAHGLAALACGDPTARDRGRLTLNPLPHVDPIGSLLVPAALLLFHSPIMIGWARPVPVDWANLKSPRDDPVKVALAGPASNLILALLFAALARAASALAGPAGSGFGSGLLAPLGLMAVAGVIVNCALALFNLIPIPPLDGSWVLMRFLPLRHIVALRQFRFAGLVLIAVLLASRPVSHAILYGPLRLAVHACLGLFGISSAEALL
jgi:Zn-dependent protease